MLQPYNGILPALCKGLQAAGKDHEQEELFHKQKCYDQSKGFYFEDEQGGRRLAVGYWPLALRQQTSKTLAQDPCIRHPPAVLSVSAVVYILLIKMEAISQWPKANRQQPSNCLQMPAQGHDNAIHEFCGSCFICIEKYIMIRAFRSDLIAR